MIFNEEDIMNSVLRSVDKVSEETKIGCTKNQAWRLVRRRFESNEQFIACFEILILEGKLIELAPTSGPGRPTQRYKVVGNTRLDSRLPKFQDEALRHMNRLHKRGAESISANDLYRNMLRQFSRHEILEGLGIMVKAGLIRKLDPRGGPGRPSVRYQVVKP